MKATQIILCAALLFAFAFCAIEAVRCGRYNANPDLNRLNYPKHPDFDKDRTYYGPPTICDDLVEPQRTFFVLDVNGTTKEFTETSAFRSGLIFGAFEPFCRTAATLFLCSSAFRPCDINPLSTSLPNFLVFPLPQPPCKSTCNAFVRYCRGIVPDENLPDCDARDSSDEPEYPERSKRFFVNGATFNVPCNRYEEIDQIDALYDEDKDEFILYPESKKKGSVGDKKELQRTLEGIDIDPVVCPFPLDLNKKYEYESFGESPCMTTCPNAGSYSDDTWDKIKKEKLAFSAISLALDIWVLLTLITLKERRLFPANLAIAVTLLHTLWMIIWTISSGRMDKTQCQDRFHYSTCWNDYLCGVEALFLYYCALAIANCWAAISLNLFALVVLEIKPKRVRKYQLLWYFFIFLVPTVGAIVIYATSNFFASPGYPWCFVRPKEYNYPLFWAWIILDILFCLVGTLGALIKMAMVKRAMSSRASFSKNLNILIFLGLFLFVYGFNITIVFYLEVNGTGFEDSLREFVACNAASANQVFDKCDDPETLSAATMYVFVWTLAGSGQFIFVSWGISLAYLRHWAKLLKMIFTCNFGEVAEMGLSSDASTRGSKTQNSKS